jgi:predicted RNA methylase
LLPLVSYFLFALASFIGYFFLSGFIWGAGYYPTSKNEIERAGLLLDPRKGSTFYDLGSGYGRIVISIAQKFDVKCIGVEIDPIKCWWTKRQVIKKRLERKVQVLHANFLEVELGNADSIFIFLSAEGPIMEKLYAKVTKECRKGTKIVSFEHKFKNWTPLRQEGRLFLYQVDSSQIKN